MIVTPPEFTPLLSPVAHDAPRTFAFRGNEILLRERDLALPDPGVLKSLAIGPANVLPVLAVAGRAFQIADWARTHQFCGACGTRMQGTPGERAMKCPACGNVAYPRIAPAMMVLVKRGRQILLARNVAVPAGGRMSALAGFLDPGESAEDAVHREVFEEVGLYVKDLRYFASQSWPFPGSLMIAFTAEYAGGELKLDSAEIAEARWFGPGDALPELSPPQSISRALIEANLPK